MKPKFQITAVTVLAFSLSTVCLMAQQEPIFELSWGGVTPRDIAIAPDDTIFVLEGGTMRRYDECGAELDSWPTGINAIAVAIWNSNLYLTNGVTSCVSVFDVEGTLQLEIGSIGSLDGQCLAPRDLAVGPNERLYVVDIADSRIKVFDSNGSFLFSWGGFGSGAGQFDTPRSIAIDSNGNVFVADFFQEFGFYRTRIQVFSNLGDHIRSWLAHSSLANATPMCLTMDSADNLYVAMELSTPPDLLQKFDTTGRCLASIRGEGDLANQFNEPDGIGVDSRGSIFVGNGLSVLKFIQPYLSSCPKGDFDGDCDSDVADFIAMTLTMTGPLLPAIVVDASCLANDTASAGSYFSNGNDLHGFATQSGFTEADWTIAWTIDSKPVGSGSVAIFDPNQLESAFVITAPALAGDYIFRLTVTNPTTNTQATDTTTLTLTP